MSDARWGDPREYGERDRDDERPRVYDQRDRDNHDPRDALMYELNGQDSRTLAAVGTFRVVPKQDLDTEHDTARHLRDERLVDTVDPGSDARGLTLTKEGRDLLDSHTLEREDGPPQVFHAGVSRPREIDHDSNLYATYCQEETRLRDALGDLEIHRVILEQVAEVLKTETVDGAQAIRQAFEDCAGLVVPALQEREHLAARP